jgi:predicted TIM-barrel fold metal-dependent hydrolase
MEKQVIDADGHVIEDGSVVDYIDEPGRYQLTGIWPSSDNHHAGLRVRSKEAFGGGRTIGPKEWSEFRANANIEYSVLYPSRGLSMGNISLPRWAIVVARAYNNWLYENYLKPDPHLKGMALVPLQDVPSAVSELRRAVTELGMLGAMLPSRGLNRHLGAQDYWPVYEEAERLGCALAVHGANHSGMGFDDFSVYTPIGGMGHPFSLMIGLSGMVFHGVFDTFPNLRVAFLEGGAAWASFWMDRLDRSYDYHYDVDAAGNEIKLAMQPSDYLRSGRIFIGCEGNEESLPYQVQRVGPQAFLFASDFPHEVSADDCRHEIAEIEQSEGLSEAHKEAILRENAVRFYGFSVDS